ncbi:MAG: glycosyltransferase family 4 protein [Deltaproteobacteria bacterium]|nr:glycosyltransferase family 4 protein [Deltaproteobacteria bacterium]
MAKVVILGSFAHSLINFRGKLLENLVRGGHTVIASAPGGSESLRNNLKNLGVSFYPVPLNRTGMNPFHDVACLLSLFRFFRRHKPDLVLGYTVKPVIYGSLSAGWAGVPSVCSLISGLGYAFSEEGQKHNSVRRLLTFMYRQGLKNNKVVFFQNPDDLNYFRDSGVTNGRSKLVLINGSGVDMEHFSLQPLPEKTSFLLIARLINEKGIREYVRAARILKKKYPALKFRLVGGIDNTPSAVSSEELQTWVGEGTIEYLGLLSDVRPAIGDCSVFVLPTFYREGTPRTVLEAMAMGRPIITTDTPGCRETVQPGKNGFFVAPRDASGLANIMERFVVQPALAEAMGRESRKLAEIKYDVRKVNRVILDNLGFIDCPT